MAKIHVVTSENQASFQQELEQACRLRYRVFVEERGWRHLERADKRDIDSLDGGESVHFLAMQDHTLVGYVRLLPKNGIDPHCFEAWKAEAIQDKPNIRGIGRFCVDQTVRAGRKTSNVGSHLLLSVCQYSVENGISELFFETSTEFIRLFKVLGFKITNIGEPYPYYESLEAFVVIEMSQTSLNRCQEKLRLSSRLIKMRSYLQPVTGY